MGQGGSWLTSHKLMDGRNLGRGFVSGPGPGSPKLEKQGRMYPTHVRVSMVFIVLGILGDGKTHKYPLSRAK